MRMGLQLLVVSVGVLLFSGFAASVVNAPQASVVPPVGPFSTGTSQKFHVIETFTGTWCPPCASADPALSRLTDEYLDNSLFLFYHCCYTTPGPNFDPYYNSVYTTRRNYYVPGSFGIPTVFFDGGGEYPDGTLVDVGSGTSPASYDMYRFELEDWVDTTSNIAVSVVGDLTPTGITATVSIYASEPVTQTNLYVRMIVYEDSVYYMGTNGAPFHRNIAHALDEQLLSPVPTVGQTVTVTSNFMLPPGVNMNKLGVAAFVQSNTKRTVVSSGYQFTIADILNGAKDDLVPRGILIHRDQGTTADYTESYEKVLSEANEHIETWNEHVLGVDSGTTDDRTMPDAATLDEVSLVVWHTGAATSGTLNDVERPLLGTHLDGGGSLFLTGSGIGFDMWSDATTRRPWFQQYLHATYESDDTGATYVNGAGGDPIGGDFAAVNLGILTSPDRINARAGDPAMPAVPFRYPGSLPAGVRVQHDTDSRVVYLGFRYFENTVDPNRGAVMTNIIDWIDGAAAPQVDVLFPDGGETLAQGSTVDLRWSAKDVRIPTNGVSIYFSPDFPTSPWQLLSSGEPNDGIYRWTVPSLDSANCRIRVVVGDSSPESGDGEATSASDFTCGSVPFFELTFTSADLGWRLISHPMILGDTSVPSVLSTIDGSYGIVRWFDASDRANPWKSYVPGTAGNDLLYIDNTVGFWVLITQPCTLQIMGTRPSSDTAVPLKAGWNLVGFPSIRADYTVTQFMADTGATRVEAFDATSAPYYLQVVTGPDVLRSGEGYWVYAPADTVWMVPYA